MSASGTKDDSVNPEVKKIPKRPGEKEKEQKKEEEKEKEPEKEVTISKGQGVLSWRRNQLRLQPGFPGKSGNSGGYHCLGHR